MNQKGPRQSPTPSRTIDSVLPLMMNYVAVERRSPYQWNSRKSQWGIAPSQTFIASATQIPQRIVRQGGGRPFLHPVKYIPLAPSCRYNRPVFVTIYYASRNIHDTGPIVHSTEGDCERRLRSRASASSLDRTYRILFAT